MSNPKIFFTLLGIVILFSLTNCCTTKDNVKDEKQMILNKNAPLPLAPGTAEVSCSIEETFEKNNKSYCKIKINSVKRYGSGTQPIGVGSVIQLELNDNLKEKLEISRSNNQSSNITIVQLMGGKGQEKNNSWKIIKIEE